MTTGTILLLVGFILLHFLMHRGHGSHGHAGHGASSGHGGGCCGGGQGHEAEPAPHEEVHAREHSHHS